MKNLCVLAVLGTCNELACPGDLFWSGYLHTLQLLSLLSIAPLEFLPPDLGAPAQSRKESQLEWWEKNCSLGSLGFPAGSLAVLTCTEPGAGGEVNVSAGISTYRGRPTWGKDFTLVARDVCSLLENFVFQIYREHFQVYGQFSL